jgi:hypothetical protein
MEQDQKIAVAAAKPSDDALPPRQNAKGLHWERSAPRGEREPKVPRDYMGPAIAACGGAAKAFANTANGSLLAAIIIAQALDRFGERLIDAAAVSQYKRSS